MTKARFALAAALCGVLAGSAQAAPQTGPKSQAEARQCFSNRFVTSFAPQGNEVVNVRVGVKDYYRLDLFGPCMDVDWNQRIALVSRGGSYICAGSDAEIISRSPIGPQRCQVRSIHKLTPVEVAALPKNSKP